MCKEDEEQIDRINQPRTTGVLSQRSGLKPRPRPAPVEKDWNGLLMGKQQCVQDASVFHNMVDTGNVARIVSDGGPKPFTMIRQNGAFTMIWGHYQ
jgi:hypothetical protein